MKHLIDFGRPNGETWRQVAVRESAKLVRCEQDEYTVEQHVADVFDDFLARDGDEEAACVSALYLWAPSGSPVDLQLQGLLDVMLPMVGQD